MIRRGCVAWESESAVDMFGALDFSRVAPKSFSITHFTRPIISHNYINGLAGVIFHNTYYATFLLLIFKDNKVVRRRARVEHTTYRAGQTRSTGRV